MGQQQQNMAEKKGPCASCAPDFAEPADLVSKGCLMTACCCSICGLYCDYPDCCGCRQKGACCCCEGKFQCSLMKLSQELTCFQTCTLCKSFAQMCCCVAGYALPCDEDVPCMIALCGIFCLGKEKLVFVGSASLAALLPLLFVGSASLAAI